MPPAPDLAPIDRSIIAILDAPASTTSIERAFAEKELHLRELFAALPAESRALLHSRITEARNGDSLADRFLRLAAHRRARVLKELEEQGVNR